MNKYFKVEAQSILTLGRDSIKDHTTAILELVKNAYDADADWVEVSIKCLQAKPSIRIADNGIGMTEKDIEEKWLRIGFSDKKEIENKVSKKGRRKTGEKGVGRLSAARLGSVLQIRTAAKNKTFGLEVDWADFDQKGHVLHEVPLKVLPNPSISVPKNRGHNETGSGTELLITKLAQEWTSDDLEKLDRELSLLISPFRKVKDFQIVLTSDLEGYDIKRIESEMYFEAIVTLNATYNPTTNKLRCHTKIIDEAKKVSKDIPISLVLSRGRRANQGNKAGKLRCGPVELTLLSYLQKDDPFEGVSLKKQDIRMFLENNAGIKIYRDDVRVKPYGDLREPEGDWLELGKRFASNPAGASRQSYRVTPNRMVGAVFLTRDNNQNLIDSTSREGLIKGDAFKDLSELVLGCVRLLETTYHQRFIVEKEKGRRDSIQRVENLGQELNEIFREIRRIAPAIVELDTQSGGQAIERLEEFSERIPDLQEAIKDIQLQNVIFRGLATIGIASSVFGHETQTLISSLVNSVNLIKKALRKSTPDIDMAIEEVEDAINFADRIGSWGEFALARVRRDKRRRKTNDVTVIVNNILKELEPPFESVGIEMRRDLESVNAVTIAMDMEAIVINLLTNAYYACSEKGGKRVISVQLHNVTKDSVPGFELIVSDSGAGVLKEFENRIWEPLFSTKSDTKKRQVGTGLGLSIVDSIVKDFGGQRSVGKDKDLHGAKFVLWFPDK